MIKMSLKPSLTCAPCEVDTLPELLLIEQMREDGLCVHAETFLSPQEENVTVFWTADDHGHVAMVWEHTYRALSFSADYRSPEDAARETHELYSILDDGYSVGE